MEEIEYLIDAPVIDKPIPLFKLPFLGEITIKQMLLWIVFIALLYGLISLLMDLIGFYPMFVVAMVLFLSAYRLIQDEVKGFDGVQWAYLFVWFNFKRVMGKLKANYEMPKAKPQPRLKITLNRGGSTQQKPQFNADSSNN